MTDAGKLGEERFCDEKHMDTKVQQYFDDNNVCVLSIGTPGDDDEVPHDEPGLDVRREEDDDLDTDTLVWDEPRGHEIFGLADGGKRAKRLGDKVSDTDCTWGKGEATQEVGMFQKVLHRKTHDFGDAGNSEVAKTGSGVG